MRDYCFNRFSDAIEIVNKQQNVVATKNCRIITILTPKPLRTADYKIERLFPFTIFGANKGLEEKSKTRWVVWRPVPQIVDVGTVKSSDYALHCHSKISRCAFDCHCVRPCGRASKLAWNLSNLGL